MSESLHTAESKFLIALSGQVTEAVSGAKAFAFVADAAAQHLGCVYLGLLLLHGGPDETPRTEMRQHGRVLAGADPQAVLLQAVSYWRTQRAAARWDHADRACQWSAWPLWRGSRLAGVLAAQWPASRDGRLRGAVAHPYLKLAASVVERGLTIDELHLAEAELIDENLYLREEIRNRFRPENFVWVSGAMDELCQAALRVAGSTATVLLQGETGTGKELLAHLIHEHSPRANGPFIRVNCAALPDTLLESELFGHVRGAFTGATADRMGRFEAADEGTIFLDEIGDISPQLQVRLLRVLQEREIERVGEQRVRRISVRVIAATHRDLEQEVAARRFREDLYYRLNVVHLQVPALRERPEDILPLVEFFLSRYNQENLKRVHIKDPAVIAAFQRCPWPGNVRELQNCVEKAVVLAAGDELTLDLLPAVAVPWVATGATPAPESTAAQGPAVTLEAMVREAAGRGEVPVGNAYRHLLGRCERPLLAWAMEQAGGNQLAASRWLGINRNTLRQKLLAHGLLAGPGPEPPVDEP